MIDTVENMTSVYDKLIGVTTTYCYKSGSVRDCTLDRENIMTTKYGEMIPKYGAEDVRRKYNPSLSFYESGIVKSIYLEKQTDIITSIGTFSADLVTFYESGAIKRLFPLNGKISGYWTEADEGNLCQTFQFHFPFGSFRVKIINLNFYENGKLKAMTLWPGESIILKTELGLLPVRIGFSLYEDGKIKSIEPTYEIELVTPIGIISAYDENALGICGDRNSLYFNKNGSISSIVTSSSRIAIVSKDGTQETMGPSIKPDPLEDNQLVIIPLRITFENHYVKFEGENTRIYDIDITKFTVINDEMSKPINSFSCGDCSSCSLCK
jgi:antitoxin component YwqK of YwqJK toxin-antitoxin module